MLVYWSIFWRTFSALELAVIGSALAWDWASDFKATAFKLLFLSAAPFLGAVGAALYAWRKSPAVTAFAKAVRAGVEKIAAGAVLIGVNEFADVIKTPNLVVPLVVAAVGSFLVTYFSAQGTVPPATASP